MEANKETAVERIRQLRKDYIDWILEAKAGVKDALEVLLHDTIHTIKNLNVEGELN